MLHRQVWQGARTLSSSSFVRRRGSFKVLFLVVFIMLTGDVASLSCQPARHMA